MPALKEDQHQCRQSALLWRTRICTWQFNSSMHSCCTVHRAQPHSRAGHRDRLDIPDLVCVLLDCPVGAEKARAGCVQNGAPRPLILVKVHLVDLLLQTHGAADSSLPGSLMAILMACYHLDYPSPAIRLSPRHCFIPSAYTRNKVSSTQRLHRLQHRGR